MDTLKSIRVFAKIVEFGSLSAAAADMNISPAMVSKHLKHLESFVEARLLHRTTRSLRLTEEGKMYYEHCQIALNKIDEVRLLLGAGKGVPNGTLRVALPRMIELTHVQPVIAEYVQRHPQMNIDLAFSDNASNLIEDGFDLVLHVAEGLPASSMIARRLASIDWVVCASPHYLARQQRPVRPDDLERHLTMTCVDRGAVWSFEKGAERIDVRLERNMFVDSRLACQFAVEEMGVAILPALAVVEPIRQGLLEVLFSDYALPQRYLFAIYPSRRYLTSRVRSFIDLLAEAVYRLPAPSSRNADVLCPDLPAVSGRKAVAAPFVDGMRGAAAGSGHGRDAAWREAARVV